MVKKIGFRQIVSLLLLLALVVGIFPTGSVFADASITPSSFKLVKQEWDSNQVMSVKYLGASYDVPTPASDIFDFGGGVTGKLEEDTLVVKKTDPSGTGIMDDFNHDTKKSPIYSTPNVKNIIIGDGVISIGMNAFSKENTSKITGTITIGDTVEIINEGAFCGNEISTIELGNKVKTIGAYAFMDNKITSLAIPNSVENIEYYSFMNNQLGMLTIPNNVKKISIRAFSSNKLERVAIGTGVEIIGISAFEKNKISDLKFSEGVKTIGACAFDTNLISTLELPNSLITIDRAAFIGNEMTNIKFGNALESIGFSSFYHAKLTSLDLPSSLKAIYTGAFNNSNLVEIKIGNNVDVADEPSQTTGKNLGLKDTYDNAGKVGKTYTWKSSHQTWGEIPDTAAPTYISNYPKLKEATKTTLSVDFKLNEAGNLKVLMMKESDVPAGGITKAMVLSGGDNIEILSADTDYTWNWGMLTPGTNYQFFSVATDKASPENTGEVLGPFNFATYPYDDDATVVSDDARFDIFDVDRNHEGVMANVDLATSSVKVSDFLSHMKIHEFSTAKVFTETNASRVTNGSSFDTVTDKTNGEPLAAGDYLIVKTDVGRTVKFIVVQKNLLKLELNAGYPKVSVKAHTYNVALAFNKDCKVAYVLQSKSDQSYSKASLMSILNHASASNVKSALANQAVYISDSYSAGEYKLVYLAMDKDGICMESVGEVPITIVDDKTKPEIIPSETSFRVGSNGKVSSKLMTTEKADARYFIYKDLTIVPEDWTFSELATELGTVENGYEMTTFNDFAQLTAYGTYNLFLQLEDTSRNESITYKFTFEHVDNKDTTAPVFINATPKVMINGQNVTVDFMLDENATLYYYVTSDAAINLSSLDANTIKTSGSAVSVHANTLKTVDLGSLADGLYKLFAVAQDAEKNSSEVKSLEFTVKAGNTEPPRPDPKPDKEPKPTNPAPSQSQPKEEPKVIVLVNGKAENAGIETIKTENGKRTREVDVNPTLIEKKIEEAVAKGTSQKNVVEIPVLDTTSQQIRVSLTGDIVKKLEDNRFDVTVTRNQLSYVIPAKELTIEAVAKVMGVPTTQLKNIEVEVQMTRVDEGVSKQYEAIARANNTVLVTAPIEFEITAKTMDSEGKVKTVDISKFSQYVQRVVEIPTGIDPSKITTGIVFNPDGSYSHVPTEVYTENGKWFAKLNSLTNSKYSAIWNPITVDAVKGHWSQKSVDDMASRLVLIDYKNFAPNQAVTRAEFADYIVRALGLYREGGQVTSKFTDVSGSHKSLISIAIANEWGILSGYPDGSFKPEATITREEAMTMYAKALKIAGLQPKDLKKLEMYKDAKLVSNWASAAVNETVNSEVFNGRTKDQLAPQGTLTKAESLTAIRNLLVKAGLINR